MCRVRNGHTDAPWTTAYICITIDNSCLDANNKFVNKPMIVKMVQWQAYCIKTHFDSKTPVCSACKRTNRTKSFCRERHRHRTLPWCTVYVVLSTVADSDDVVSGTAASSEKNDVKSKDDKTTDEKEELDAWTNTVKLTIGRDETTDEKEEGDAWTNRVKSTIGRDLLHIANKTQNLQAESQIKEDELNLLDSIEGETISSDPIDPGDDINDVPESRTFLAKVSSRSITIHWLELSDWGFHPYDDGAVENSTTRTKPSNQHTPAMIPIPHFVDPNHAQLYASNMGYAAQQHQNALQSRQQYFFQLQQQQQHAQQHQAGNPHNPYPQPVHPWAPPPSKDHPQGGTAGEAAVTQQQNHYQRYHDQANQANGSIPSTSEQASDADQPQQRDTHPQHELQGPPPPMHHMPFNGHAPLPQWPMYYHHPPPPVMHYSPNPSEMVNGHPPPYHYMAMPGPMMPIRDKVVSDGQMDQYQNHTVESNLSDAADDDRDNKRQRI